MTWTIRTAGLEDAVLLSELYACNEPERQGELLSFWQRWFTQIPGKKITLLALNQVNQPLGAVRFWQSPYCGDKWLVEGLEVAAEARCRGIGSKLVREGINRLVKAGHKSLYAHIHLDNTASIILHTKLGFVLVSEGYINSWGSPRQNGNEYLRDLSINGD